MNHSLKVRIKTERSCVPAVLYGDSKYGSENGLNPREFKLASSTVYPINGFSWPTVKFLVSLSSAIAFVTTAARLFVSERRINTLSKLI